jgi:tetratricopeptide (TPR) repeat protein
MDGGNRRFRLTFLREAMTTKAAFLDLCRRAWLPVVLVVGAFVGSLAPIADGDVFWHLAAGREMVQRHALLRVDPFSVSAAGRPWPDVHWLFQLAVYGVYSLAGLRGLVLAKSALVALGAGVLFTAVPRRGRPLFVPAFLVATFLARHLLLVRPVIVTLVIAAVFFARLERYRRERRAGLLAPLPLLQVLWTNVQGLFALGPSIVAAYAAGAVLTLAFGDRAWFPFPREGGTRAVARTRAKHLVATTACTALASLASPFGASAIALPGRLFARILPTHANVFSAAVAENVPPYVLERSSPSEMWHLKWFLGALAVCVVLAARRTTASHLLLLVALVALALMGNRNIALLYWLAPAIVAIDLSPLAARTARRLRAANRGFLAARLALPTTLVAALALSTVAAAREPAIASPAPFRFPEASASLIEQLRGGGEIFSADHQGGYLIFRLYPRFRPYIDTRLILRTASEYEEYLGFADDPARFDAFQRRHHFAAIVLPVAYPDRYLGLIRHLYQGRDFKLAYTDGSEALFLRREGWADDGVNLGSPETTERLVSEIASRFAGDPRLLSAARVELATLDAAVGELDEAVHALSGLTAPDALSLVARLRAARGELDSAERMAERALADDAKDVRALDLLATVSARRGELRRAGTFLRQALAVDPFDVEASHLLATMEDRQHER